MDPYRQGKVDLSLDELDGMAQGYRIGGEEMRSQNMAT